MNDETIKTIEAIKAAPKSAQWWYVGVMGDNDMIASDALKALATSHESLQSEVDRLRTALGECRDKWDTAGNGKCDVCQFGHRLFDLKGSVQECDNSECLSHRIRKALEV